MYYLNSRYYDPNIGRFLNIDGAMGCNSDMSAYNLYSYCGNNPVVRYDAGGMFWKELIDKALHCGNDLAVAIGIDTAAIGAFFLNMEKDSSGIYHSKNDFWQWQRIFGYNDLYDIAFDIGTSMVSKKFPFTYNGTEYILWAWKGDYINLGAGAELGIYYGGEPHWLVDRSLAMDMALWVDYNGNEIINYQPYDFQWWITAFNPNYRNVNANDLSVSVYVEFNDWGMFNAFKAKYGWPVKSGWQFPSFKFPIAMLYF